MKSAFKEKMLIRIIFILTLVLLSANGFFNLTSPSATLGASPDAIGIRVIPNPDYLSPLRWYQENIKVKGSPQALTVDGYQAVRDGRTVYVNAANIDFINEHCSNDSSIVCRKDDNCSDKGRGVCSPSLYTNIYVISYNQAAENATVDIFGQILAHWKFNKNITDSDIKDKVVRDTKRLADLADIKLALKNYQAGHNGTYPSLAAGSYLAGKTISTWPSWRATLGAALGVTLPVDPVNRLGTCTGFDSTTCWNQTTKKFFGAVNGDQITLPGGSRAYVYTIGANGVYRLCASMESNYLTTLQGACSNPTVGHSALPPSQFPITINCGELKGYAGQAFTGFVSATYSGSDALTWSIITQPDSAWGGDTINIQNTTAPKQKKLLSSSATTVVGSYTVKVGVTNSSNVPVSKDCPITIGECGDGIINGPEKCDGTIGVGPHQSCSDTCTLINEPWCGDLIKNDAEQCDGTDGVVAHQSCSATCTLNTLLWCGDRIVTAPEECDDGHNINGDGCSSTCRFETQPGDCDAIIHQSNTTRWNGSQFTQIWNGSTYQPATKPSSYSVSSIADAECTFGCEPAYSWDTNTSTCVLKCGNGVVDQGEDCDPNNINTAARTKVCNNGIVTRGGVGGPPASATWCPASWTADGIQSCQAGSCVWGSCTVPAASNNTATGCGYPPAEAANGYTCCEIISCAQDVCGCCGWQDATVTAGYTRVASTSVTWDPRVFAENYQVDNAGSYIGSCTGGYLDVVTHTYVAGAPVAPQLSIPYLCTSCNDKFSYDKTSWNPKAKACSLNRDITNNPKNWEITVNHSTASYRCWQ